MPAKSKAQRKMMAIAEYSPEKLYARNSAVLKMTQAQLSDFASTKEKKLPKKKTSAVGKQSLKSRKK